MFIRMMNYLTWTIRSSRKISLKGGGRFPPIADLIAEDEEDPEIVLYLTDGYGSAPKAAKLSVIWELLKVESCL